MTASELAFAWRSTRRGVRLLTWRDPGTLARELRVLWSALTATPSGDNSALAPLKPAAILIDDPQRLPMVFRDTIGKRQEADTVAEHVDEQLPLLMLVARGAAVPLAAELNGWRRALAQAAGTLLVVTQAEELGFRRHAPDLASLFEAGTTVADEWLALWDAPLVAALREHWLSAHPPSIPSEIDVLTGGAFDRPEFERWLTYHLQAATGRT